MASIEPGALLDFAKSLESDGRSTGGMKLATVVRVDGEQAYVKIPGGVEETPVATSGSVLSVGDIVSVSVQNGKLRANANVSNPSAGILKVQGVEKTANDAVYIAQSAEGSAAVAYNAATSAVESAATAYSAAQQAISDASDAATAASNAQTSADNAATAASNAQTSADNAATAASNAQTSATTAYNAAVAAQASATNANEYASRALGNLSTVQSVAETLTWVTQHGTMTLTSDTAPDPTHVYFVRDANGDYVVGSYHYSIVADPVQANMGSYYELSIDESLNNYVGTHLALTSEGLWLLPAQSGTHKVLVATGAGSTYTSAGTYIIDPTGGVVGKFTSSEVVIGDVLNGSYVVIDADSLDIMNASTSGGTTNSLEIAHFGYGRTYGSGNNISYTLGKRLTGSGGGYGAGSYSVVEGYNNIALGDYSHAEGISTKANGRSSHAEGGATRALGDCSHAEGDSTEASGTEAHSEGINSKASGNYSHSQNEYTIAAKKAQTALGTYNVEDVATTTTHPSGTAAYGKYSVVIGNGTSDSARSNALTVDWNGNVECAGNVSAVNATFSGNLTAAGGTFSGNVSAVGGILSGDLSAVNGSFSGNVSAVGGTFTGDVSADDLTASTITLAGHSTAVGSQLSTSISSAQTVSNNSTTALGSISLPTGTWLLMAHVQFSNNTTGYREISLSTTSGTIGETYDHMSFAKSQAPSGGNAVLNCHDVVVNSSSSNVTYYLNAWQNSGSSLTATGKIIATRLL